MRSARQVIQAGAVVLAAALCAASWIGPAPAHAAQASWVWPVQGHAVLRAFSPPADRYAAGHRGVDLTATSSTVVAAGAGRVSYAGMLAGRGVVVVVHGDLRTTYEPVTASVRVGQQVAAGASLGRLGGVHVGCSSSCLHWGLLRGDVYLDPLSLLRRGPSRLLPVPGGAGAQGAAADQRAASTALPFADRRAASSALRAAHPPPLLPVAVADQGWSLRSARTRSAGGAVLALLLGLALLVRRPPRPDPEAPALAQCAASAQQLAGLPEAEPAPVQEARIVDLTAHRARRRA